MLNVVVPFSAFWPQTIQSARLSFHSYEMGLPHRRVAPPPFGSNGEDTLARGRVGGGGGGANPKKGTTRWYTIYTKIPL